MAGGGSNRRNRRRDPNVSDQAVRRWVTGCHSSTSEVVSTTRPVAANGDIGRT